jgi:hypothetical protein
MLVLSAVELESAAYGSARKTIKKLDPIHNKGLRIALGAFCINRTQNLLIEAGESTLQQTRNHNSEHGSKKKKANDQYGLRPSLTTLFFVSAKETCSIPQRR